MSERKSLPEFIGLWVSLINGPVPSREQFSLWTVLHADDVVLYGITATAKKFMMEHGKMGAEYLTRYASKVMSNRAPSQIPKGGKQYAAYLRKTLYH
jgi:hypothetical protein